MKKILLTTFILSFLLAIPRIANSQTKVESDSIYLFTDEMPQFTGGEIARMKFILNNINYPSEYYSQNLEDNVYVSFIVEKDGSTSNVKILKSNYPKFDEEAKRIILSMPNWIPAKLNGKQVRFQQQMIVPFKKNTLAFSQKTIDNDKSDVIEELKNDISKENTDSLKNNLKEDPIFTFVDNLASFSGGENKRIRFIEKNLKYPQQAKDKGIQGVVYVQFVVEKDGSITNIKILRGIGYGCDEEVISVIKLMPKWNPGTQNGYIVRSQFNMPIKFSLTY
jgi:TonB family protein